MSEYVKLISQSHSVAFADYIRNKELEGETMIKVQTGDPEYPTHEDIVEAAKVALNNNQTKYCNSRGLKELREALSVKLSSHNKIDCSPEKNILITHGAVHGINIAIKALLSKGDECIILEPYWRSYEANVILNGAVPVIVSLSRDNGFDLIAEEVLDRITEKTKVIIINTPNNPSGAIYKQEELSKLIAGAASKGVYVISDEVYEAITFDESKHYSLASDPEHFRWIISVFSFSKSYSMTGWRIGYLVASEELIDSILKLSQFSITSLSPFAQLGALKALTSEECNQQVEERRLLYEEKRTFIGNQVSGTWLESRCILPKGAFYVLIDMSEFNQNSLELAKAIADQHKVCFTPGVAFGDSMDSFLRMSLTASMEDLSIAVSVLVSFGNEFFQRKEMLE